MPGGACSWHLTAKARDPDSEEKLRDSVIDTANPFGSIAAEATMTSLDLLKMPSSPDLSPHLMVSWPQSLIILKWKKKISFDSCFQARAV